MKNEDFEYVLCSECDKNEVTELETNLCDECLTIQVKEWEDETKAQLREYYNTRL